MKTPHGPSQPAAEFFDQCIWTVPGTRILYLAVEWNFEEYTICFFVQSGLSTHWITWAVNRSYRLERRLVTVWLRLLNQPKSCAKTSLELEIFRELHRMLLTEKVDQTAAEEYLDRPEVRECILKYRTSSSSRNVKPHKKMVKRIYTKRTFFDAIKWFSSHANSLKTFPKFCASQLECCITLWSLLLNNWTRLNVRGKNYSDCRLLGSLEWCLHLYKITLEKINSLFIQNQTVHFLNRIGEQIEICKRSIVYLPTTKFRKLAKCVSKGVQS